MASVGYTQNCFNEMVAESRILFRHGTTDLINYSQFGKVPLFVLSAGIKEVIDASFKIIYPGNTDQLKVLSNSFKYSHDGKTIAPPESDELVNPTTKKV
jgi:2-hydroxy-3-keto-5-methylthiopentenyl-1-phosphate phosphatase